MYPNYLIDDHHFSAALSLLKANIKSEQLEAALQRSTAKHDTVRVLDQIIEGRLSLDESEHLPYNEYQVFMCRIYPHLMQIFFWR
ncbi:MULTISPECIES: hypothetical protein [Aliiglaciecola]|uniref:hypothetical protein n=1 Tax=Aliiglaciecola TaxID=1406885 RepID=UPI001C099672|nr:MULTISPECIES: hypothetical protein [Aliiglaciecola]MBU2878721.1 hypothetical protein [Aliiglaciecola lipolytica]MDO6711382.1 hypothetical protein [Aliiglaciecola sp. 2_MG-2023]MDO6752169.1 hypothetical protein [Aliiglaciecola sp. 1_MG-2023]